MFVSCHEFPLMLVQSETVRKLIASERHQLMITAFLPV